MRAGVQGQTEDRKSFLRGEEVKDRRSPPISPACLMPQMQTVGWVGGSSGGVGGGGFTIKKTQHSRMTIKSRMKWNSACLLHVFPTLKGF